MLGAWPGLSKVRRNHSAISSVGWQVPARAHALGRWLWAESKGRRRKGLGQEQTQVEGEVNSEDFSEVKAALGWGWDETDGAALEDVFL